MTSRTKVWVAYGALILISGLFLVRFLHSRSLYRCLGANRVLASEPAPVAEPPAAQPEPELTMQQAGLVIFADKGRIDSWIIATGVRHGVKEGLVALETDIGMALPGYFDRALVSNVRDSIGHAARSAMEGEDMAKWLAGYSFENYRPQEQEAIRKRVLTRPGRREELETMLQSIKRQLERMEKP